MPETQLFKVTEGDGAKNFEQVFEMAAKLEPPPISTVILSGGDGTCVMPKQTF